MLTPAWALRGSALVLALLLAGPVVPQSAAAPTYNIEVIVFRTAAIAANAADAAGPGGLREPTDGDPAGSARGGGSARVVATLPATSFQLDDIETKLRANGGYRPLAHAAWTQTPAAWGSRVGVPLSRVGVAGDGLSGVVHLERGQYLHLGFTMTYNNATISEIRRVRFNEKNYFDNPSFGIIAVVTPARR